jgi:hypothetical protein
MKISQLTYFGFSFESIGAGSTTCGASTNSSLDMSLYAGTEYSCFLTYCHRILLQDPSRSTTVVTSFHLHLAGGSMFSGGLYYQPPLIVEIL